MTMTGPDQTSARGGETLAEYIRRRRVALDLSQAEAARRAGVSRRTWHEIEHGARTGSTALTLSAIDQALQLPEGTCWRFTANSTIEAAEDLRRRAMALVRRMSYDELEYFIAHRGAETLTAKIDDMSQELMELRRVFDALSDQALGGNPADDGSSKRRPVGRPERTNERPGASSSSA